MAIYYDMANSFWHSLKTFSNSALVSANLKRTAKCSSLDSSSAKSMAYQHTAVSELGKEIRNACVIFCFACLSSKWVLFWGSVPGQWFELHFSADKVVAGNLVNLFSSEQNAVSFPGSVLQNLHVADTSLLPLLGLNVVPAKERTTR